MQFLVSKVVLGPENTRIAVIASQEDHQNAALAEQEARGIAIGAIFRADVLDRVKDRFGVPAKKELTDFLTTPHIPAELAERMARALELYWLDEYDESVHVILPRIEAAIRNICRDMGFVIIREPQNMRPGRVKPLGELLAGLKGFYGDESWRRYLWNLLTEPLGTNLRNLYLHGLVPPGTREHSALLIQVACHVRLIRIQTPEAPGKAIDDSSPSSGL